MAAKKRVKICDKCSKCIYRWSGGCPGLSQFSIEKCKNMLT
ncbi:hypothetical protein [Desulfallas sp. Bu1-1]|jgi:hypothetical protein|nr:hypothetical protein [Desulfallas sp. Bu1-1]